MSLPSLLVTARLSLGTQVEPKNTFWGQEWGSGPCSMPPHPSGHTQSKVEISHLRPKATLSLSSNLRTWGKPRGAQLFPPNPVILQYSLSLEKVSHPPTAKSRTQEAIFDIHLSPAWIRLPDPGGPLPVLRAPGSPEGLPPDNAQQKIRALHPCLETKQTYATPGQCRQHIQLSGNRLCSAFSKGREPSWYLMPGFPSELRAEAWVPRSTSPNTHSAISSAFHTSRGATEP